MNVVLLDLCLLFLAGAIWFFVGVGVWLRLRSVEGCRLLALASVLAGIQCVLAFLVKLQFFFKIGIFTKAGIFITAVYSSVMNLAWLILFGVGVVQLVLALRRVEARLNEGLVKKDAY